MTSIREQQREQFARDRDARQLLHRGARNDEVLAVRHGEAVIIPLGHPAYLNKVTKIRGL